MSLLFISIATSGLFTPGSPPPWICRVVADLCGDNNETLDYLGVSVRSDNRPIDTGATFNHGITPRDASQRAVHELMALRILCGMAPIGDREKDFYGMCNSARALIAWDADFTLKIITTALARYSEPADAWGRAGLHIISLREQARDFCKIPGNRPGRLKTPTRDEAARILFGTEPRELPHTADSNIALERGIFMEIRARAPHLFILPEITT